MHRPPGMLHRYIFFFSVRNKTQQRFLISSLYVFYVFSENFSLKCRILKSIRGQHSLHIWNHHVKMEAFTCVTLKYFAWCGRNKPHQRNGIFNFICKFEGFAKTCRTWSWRVSSRLICIIDQSNNIIFNHAS